MRLRFLTALLLAALPGSALAEAAGDPPYLDDRSSAASLVRSFYNAISRQDYARAWSYFGDAKPAADFEAFAKGYADTKTVFVETGGQSTATEEDVTRFRLPVAILAFARDDSERVFAGCYTVSRSDAAAADGAWTGLVIEQAKLAPAEQPFEAQLPADCDGHAPDAADAILERVKTVFASTRRPECYRIRPDWVSAEPDSYSIRYVPQSASEGEPEREARLFRFFCGAGAYNESHVYYLYDELDGLRPLQFATPDLDIRYVSEESDKEVEHIGIKGFKAADQIVNSFYDEATRTITSFAKWRGVGDASSSGTWLFRDGEFTLVKYDVDATYNEEIDPETILDYDTAP
jgi:hypothetical protein